MSQEEKTDGDRAETAQERRERDKRRIDEARARVLSFEANRHLLAELAKR